MAIDTEGLVAQTETDLRVAVRMFHPGERHCILFRVNAGIPHLNQLGDLVQEGQITLIDSRPKPRENVGLGDIGAWRDPVARTRLIEIRSTFNWETFTKLFLDTNLLEAIYPYEE